MNDSALRTLAIREKMQRIQLLVGVIVDLTGHEDDLLARRIHAVADTLGDDLDGLAELLGD